MNWADFVNGSFEFLGGLLLWTNVRRAYRDKEFKGVAIAPTAFFAAWGFWNLYFYPSLGQWLSFVGGLNIVIANTIWVGQMVYYSMKKTATGTFVPCESPVVKSTERTITCEVRVASVVGRDAANEFWLSFTKKYPVRRLGWLVADVSYGCASGKENKYDIRMACGRAAKKAGIPMSAITVGPGRRE